MIKDLLIKLLSFLVEEPKVIESDVVTRSLYFPMKTDVIEFMNTIELIKDDYYYKTADTGTWKMVTNEDEAVKDKVFIVTISSYQNDSKSVEYADRFANYLERWFEFTELKSDWSK